MIDRTTLQGLFCQPYSDKTRNRSNGTDHDYRIGNFKEKKKKEVDTSRMGY